MIKKLIILVVLISVYACAQGRYSTPTSYTPFLGLRNYAVGANPGNGINLNNQTIDTWAQSIETMLQAAIEADWSGVFVNDADSLGGKPASAYLEDADSADIRAFSDLKYPNKSLSNLGTTSINTSLIPNSSITYENGTYEYSWLSMWTRYLYIKSNVSNNYGVFATSNVTGIRTLNFPDATGTIALTSDLASYATEIVTDSLAEDIASKQDALVSGTNIKTINSVSILGSGNIAIAAGADTSIINNLIEANEDSSGEAIIGTTATLDSIITAYWAGSLAGNTDTTIINNLIEANEDSSGDALIGTAATLDSIITDYWAGTLSGTSITTYKQGYDIIEMAYIDTFMIFWVDDSLTVDSIKAECSDSVEVQFVITAPEKTNVYFFEGSEGYVNGTATISAFTNRALVPDDRLYLYFTYIGDTATRLKLKIYWRYN